MRAIRRCAFTLAAGACAALAACESDRDQDHSDSMRGDSHSSVRSTNSDPSSYRKSDGGIQGRSASSVNDKDRSFVLEAASGGMFEVQSSQFALSANPDSQTREVAQ